MINLTKEQYDNLKPYEVHLTRGYKGNYAFGMTKANFDYMYAIYQAAGGQSSLKPDCSSCVLRLTKDLGEAYFRFQDQLTTDTMKAAKKAVKTAKKGGKE